MSNINNDENNTFVRADCEISAADVAYAEVYPKRTHKNKKEENRGGENAGLNSHLRNAECGEDCACRYSVPSPSEPADSACSPKNCECGEECNTSAKTEGGHTRPTNPSYKMIDPDDDSADVGKS